MERRIRISTTILILIVIVYFPSIGTLAKTNNSYLVYTRIASITWEPSSYEYPNENYSYFDFIIEYEILNPNSTEITLTFPYCNLLFTANFSVNFENPELEIYYYAPVGLCAIAEITIKPGIINGTIMHVLAIMEEGYNTLPDGVYSIGIFGYGVPEVIQNPSILIVEEGEISIDYKDFLIETTEETNFIGFIGIFLVILTLPFIRKMKKIKTKLN